MPTLTTMSFSAAASIKVAAMFSLCGHSDGKTFATWPMFVLTAALTACSACDIGWFAG